MSLVSGCLNQKGFRRSCRNILFLAILSVAVLNLCKKYKVRSTSEDGPWSKKEKGTSHGQTRGPSFSYGENGNSGMEFRMPILAALLLSSSTPQGKIQSGHG